jgi:hypothetical protein
MGPQVNHNDPRKGICPLCRKLKVLKKSHSISNAFFKEITRQSSGKGIFFGLRDEDPVTLSSDTWWDYLLCGECEAELNDSIERYSISVLRGEQGNQDLHEDGITLRNVDLSKLQLYIMSVFWRAAHSKHDAYQELAIAQPFLSKLRGCLMEYKSIPPSLATIKVSKVIDRTIGFSPDDLNDLIYLFGGNILKRALYKMLFRGFLFEIYVPGLKYGERKAEGVICPSNKVFFIPYLNIADNAELTSIFKRLKEKADASNIAP